MHKLMACVVGLVFSGCFPAHIALGGYTGITIPTDTRVCVNCDFGTARPYQMGRFDVATSMGGGVVNGVGPNSSAEEVRRAVATAYLGLPFIAYEVQRGCRDYSSESVKTFKLEYLNRDNHPIQLKQETNERLLAAFSTALTAVVKSDAIPLKPEVRVKLESEIKRKVEAQGAATASVEWVAMAWGGGAYDMWKHRQEDQLAGMLKSCINEAVSSKAGVVRGISGWVIRQNKASTLILSQTAIQAALDVAFQGEAALQAVQLELAAKVSAKWESTFSASTLIVSDNPEVRFYPSHVAWDSFEDMAADAKRDQKELVSAPESLPSQLSAQR